MAFNVNGGSDGPSFENPDALGKKVQQSVKNVSASAQQQAKASKKSFIDQLYGNTVPSGEDSDVTESGGQQSNTAQKIQQQMGNSSSADVSNIAKSPEEQAQIAILRKKLHKENYFDYETKTVSEEAVLAVAHQRDQEWQERQQEEAEEAQKEAEEKAQREEAMGATEPAGKSAKTRGNGRNRMSRPIALERAKTRTEINRGTTG